jgi:L-serine dehydratase
LISIFDILGPIMIGPSSSHKAGAVRIGKMARFILGEEPTSIELHFYGSLAETYHGHMTDAGTVGGLLNSEVDDPQIKNALESAQQRGIKIRTLKQTESEKNPNTIEMGLQSAHNSSRIVGITVGGGEILISEIDDFDVAFRGDQHLLLVMTEGTAIESIRKVFADILLSIRSIHSNAHRVRELVCLQLSHPAGQTAIEAVEQLAGVKWVRSCPSLYPYRLHDSTPLYDNFDQLLNMAQSQDKTLPGLISEYESKRSNLSETEIRQMIKDRWAVMKEAAHAGLNRELRLIGGITSGADGKSLFRALEQGKLVAGKTLSLASARAVATAEVNAAMGRVVAAPTAGACGVIPGVLITLAEERESTEAHIVDALLVAAGVGVLIAMKAPVSGAMGGCQSEVGVASAMSAAAAVQLAGGTASQAIDAMSFALKNILGLVCDPVAGPVEVPCIKRNVIGVANALTAANLALAGIQSVIPPDEVVDALRNVQQLMPVELRDTTLGGLGCTRTAKRLKEQWLERFSS